MAGKAPPLPYGLATITVLKGMIGTGILGLPYIFGKVHLGLAAPGMVATASVGAFSVWRLIECKDLVKALADAGPEDSETSVDRAMLGLGPLGVVGWQCFGSAGVAVAAFGILASQLGFAVSYVDVVVETLGEPTLLGALLPSAALRVALCAVLCGLCLLRRLNSLAWLSVVALLIYVYLLLALVYYGGRELSRGNAPDPRQAWLPVRWQSFGAWFGTAIFAQEAIVISQYVYDEMQLADRRDYLPVLFSSFGVSGALFTFVGTFGYLCYGDGVQNVFYLSFPADSAAVTIGEAVLCVVLVFTFALQMYPVMSFLEAVALGMQPGWDAPSAEKVALIEQEAGGNASDSESTGTGELDRRSLGAVAAALRCAMVVAICVFAAYVPNLACISGYSGCFAMSTIGFFMPSLCHIKLRGARLSPAQWLGDGLLLFAGCCALFFGVSSMSC